MEEIVAVARNIVSQLFDEAEVSVEKRQAINDRCDAFVIDMLMRLINDLDRSS